MDGRKEADPSGKNIYVCASFAESVHKVTPEGERKGSFLNCIDTALTDIAGINVEDVPFRCDGQQVLYESSPIFRARSMGKKSVFA
jgi:hypothetical protein